jgi:hypothetical protein
MRIDAELFEKVKTLADSEKRSATKQIEVILEQYFQTMPKEQ